MTTHKAALADPDAAPWWSGTAQGELRYQRCDDCDSVIFYPRSLCPKCFSASLSWFVATGGATIYAVTVIHRAPASGLSAEVPYVVALVDVDEGFRMLTRIVDVAPSQVRIGQRVELVFRELPDGRRLPCFRSLA